MPFSFAGAAKGTNDAKKLQSDLEDALAERAYRQATIQVEQAQNQRLLQQMQMDREESARKQQALESVAQATNDPLKAAAIKAGILTGRDILPTPQKAEEPFTLGPGQARYGPDGKLIAQGSAPVTATAQGFTLSPGQARYGPDGKLLAQSAPRPAAAAKSSSGAVSPQQQSAIDAYSAERVQRTRQAISELKGQIGIFTAGPGHMLYKIPGTPARNLDAQLNTLKANIAFNELAQMRAASKTGGALGQISDMEEKFLSSTLGALDPGQSPEVLKGQLEKIDQSLQRWQAAQQQYGGGPAAPSGGPKVGEQRTINGQRAQWDGHGWVAVK